MNAMSFDDWIKILTLLIPSLISLGGVFLTARVNYKISMSRDVSILELEMDDSDDCVVKSDKDYGDSLGRVPRCHARLRLNIRGSASGAKKCGVKLLRIYELDSTGRATSISYPNKQFLLWNNEGKRGGHVEKDLPCGTEQYADLLYTQVIGGNTSVKLKDNDYTQLPLQMGRVYRFEVQATAGNARAVGRIVEVELGQNYNDVKIKRSRIVKV